MAIEIIQHGTHWVNEENLKLKCPECGKKRSSKEVKQTGDNVTVTFTCNVCGCIFKLEREITE